MHLGLSFALPFDEALHTSRELVLFVLLVALGGLLLYQDRLLDRRAHELAIERDEAHDQIAWRKHIEAERERLIADLEAKNAELERFNYSVSHDLRSPLVTIRAFVGAVDRSLREGDERRAEEDIARVRIAAAQMQRMLDELLELSLAGKAADRAGEVPLREIAREARDALRGPIAEGNVEVALAYSLPVVRGQRRRLTQVFQNLIENAVRFRGEQPAPKVEVGVRRGGAGEVTLFVRDNGIGIEPAYHETVFGLFDRLDATSPGTGVGLTLVRRIVETHGGRIWVESDGEGHGSTFAFTLPTVRPSE
jgi:signal transduction histidine kinase